MSAYIDTYREWQRIKLQLRKSKHTSPERYQEMKKKEREILAKLNELIN